MVGFPYYNDGCNDQIYLSDHVYDNASVFAFITIIVAFGGLNPAHAVDVVAGAAANAGGNKTRSAAVVALLASVDAVACNKSIKCLVPSKDKVVETVTKNPKGTAAFVCFGAMVWCARGVVERVVNQHL